MIVLRNTQRKISINKDQVKKDAQKILDYFNYSDCDLGIWFTSQKMIHWYNKEYRHKDKPTDILSFSYHPHLKPGKTIQFNTEEDENIGDIIISPEYVYNDLAQWGHNFEERLQILLVHGICHLLGYDHIKDKDYAIMDKKEKEILAMLAKN